MVNYEQALYGSFKPEYNQADEPKIKDGFLRTLQDFYLGDAFQRIYDKGNQASGPLLQFLESNIPTLPFLYATQSERKTALREIDIALPTADMLLCQTRLSYVSWAIRGMRNYADATKLLPFLGVVPPESKRGFTAIKDIAQSIDLPESLTSFPSEPARMLLGSIDDLEKTTKAKLYETRNDELQTLAIRKAKAEIRKARVGNKKNSLTEPLLIRDLREPTALDIITKLRSEEVVIGEQKFSQYDISLDKFVETNNERLTRETLFEMEVLDEASLDETQRKKYRKLFFSKAKSLFFTQIKEQLTDEDLVETLGLKLYRDLAATYTDEAVFEVLKANGYVTPYTVYNSKDIRDRKDNLIEQIIARVNEKAQLPVELQEGEWKFDEIEEKMQTALGLYGITDTLYETAASKRLSTVLGEKAAQLPWLYLAEGPYESSSQEFFTAFSGSLYDARKLIKDFITNPEDVYILARKIGYDETKIKSLSLLINYIGISKVPRWFPPLSSFPTILESPVVFERGDFARVVREDQVTYVATELEDSPGAIGISSVVFAGYEGCSSDLAEKIKGFMATIDLEETTKVDRDRLTIVTTNDWEEYKKDAQVLLAELQKQGIKTSLVTIEDLVQQDGQIDTIIADNIPPGFIYNFAYLSNFFKNPDTYFVNVLEDPDRVALLLGRDVSDILQYEANETRRIIQESQDALVADFRSDPSQSPLEIIQQKLQEIYSYDILTLPSNNPLWQGMTLQEISKITAVRMREASLALYARQGKDTFIFNDPALGQLINGKNDLAILSLPQFQEFYEEVLTKAYRLSPERTSALVEILRRNIAMTVPLIPETGVSDVDNYVRAAMTEATTNPNDWIIKVVSDFERGQLDWGGRGTFVFSDYEGINQKDIWRELIEKARNNPNFQFVMQQVIPNSRFDSTRNKNTTGTIEEASNQQIGIFDRDPSSTTYASAIIAPSAVARVSPFTFSYPTKQGLETPVASGLATITIFDPLKSNATMVRAHGSTQSVETPIVFRSYEKTK